MNNYSVVARAAALWALNQTGCSYSQANRLQDRVFDCSSLIARAYIALGKRWRYGGDVPISMYEVYDDDFELIWPTEYAQIGKKMGGSTQILMAREPGNLQFLCTDPSTRRINRITHVAMVCDENRIVHARGERFGVGVSHISTFDGKVCALARYNPSGPLRHGMCGWRTLALQRELNHQGFDLTEDGEFGEKTEVAIKRMQNETGLAANGVADKTVLTRLNLISVSFASKAQIPLLHVTGNSVYLRKGPGTEYPIAGIAHSGDLLAMPDTGEWSPVLAGNAVLWINRKLCLMN